MGTERCATPLGWAARDGKKEMVQFLIDLGAEVKTQKAQEGVEDTRKAVAAS